MVRIIRLICLIACAASLPLQAERAGEQAAASCQVPWSLQLEHNNLSKPKPYGDNSNAAYASFLFVPSKNKRILLHGKFFRAQFSSWQTQSFTKQSDARFDYQLVPDAGSVNPFVPPTSLEAPNRSVTIELRPEGTEPSMANSLIFKTDAIQVLTIRVYQPFEGELITPEDLPTVRTVHTDTLQATSCPSFVPLSNDTSTELRVSKLYSVFTTALLKARYELPPTGSKETNVRFFWVSSSELGNANQATRYLVSNNEMRKGQVAVLRVKHTPEFAATYQPKGALPMGTQVRGWSICAMDYQTFYNYGCLPDRIARRDSEGYVTIVIGNSEAVKARAQKSGANYFPDTRFARDIAGNEVVSHSFYLRNLLPTCEYAQQKMYRGDACPAAVICHEQDYLAGNCKVPAVGDCSLNAPEVVACSEQ